MHIAEKIYIVTILSFEGPLSPPQPAPPNFMFFYK